MALKDYDVILDLIEDDLTLDWLQIKTRITKKLCIKEEKVNEFFKLIHPEGATMRSHYTFRRACSAMMDCTEGYTQEVVSEKYNYTDASNLSNEIKKRLGKSATDLLEEGFTRPKLQYISDLVQNEGIIVSDDKSNDVVEEKERIISRMHANEEKLKNELISAIDKIIALETSNDQLKACIRKNNIEEQINGKEIALSNLSVDMYEEFLNIERCRLIYDLTPENVLKLYHKSLETGENLEKLCIEADENYVFEEPNYIDSDIEIEWLNYRTEYEGSLMDNYLEHYGDDDLADCEDDPYSRCECDEWEYEKTRDYSPEIELEELEEQMREAETEDDNIDWDLIDKIILESENNEDKKYPDEKEQIIDLDHIKDEDIPF